MKETTKASRLSWIVAGAVLVLLAGFYFSNSVNPSTNEQIFAAFFTPFEDEISEELDLMLSVRSAGEEDAVASLRMLREGMEHYNNKEYDKAIPIFQEYLEKNSDASDYNQIKFYLGVSFLSQGETERSAKIFEELVDLDDQELKEDAKWYLSLAYTRSGATDKAKVQLQDLASSEKYSKRAEKILNPTKSKVAFR